MVVKQISSLEKVRKNSDMCFDEIYKTTVLRGERFSYQIAMKVETAFHGILEVESELGNCVKTFYVENAVLDTPVGREAGIDNDENYITKERGFMPDILIPSEDKLNIIHVSDDAGSVWVEVNIPSDCPAGSYDVVIKLSRTREGERELCFEKKLEVEVIDESIQPQSLIYTRWLYVDCIADYHCVEVYSERHWELIEKYIRQAVDAGVNMILVPVHTPPLDTAVGLKRTCVQLVDIEKTGDSYSFGFDKFRRFISLCQKCGIKYFEIAHMFSQWGAKNAPNIVVTENGKADYMFGWHTDATSEEYVSFLKQYISAISAELENEGISENTYFHISDEPSMETIDAYKRASDIIKPLIGKSKTLDALSEYDFYEKRLVEIPVTMVSAIEKFLEHDVEHQWVYYCCFPQTVYTNSFLSMPLSRVRILGVLIYKYNIEGFLHWGLNFYNGYHSKYKINPYLTTSADGIYPSGDGFILYPANNGVYGSVRGKVTFEAISDMNLCRTLEKYIGRDEVVSIIDSCAQGDVTFSCYPTQNKYFTELRNRLIEKLREYM